jgi:hypothetical protein
VTLAASGNATADASYSHNFGDGATPTVSSDASVTKPEWEGTYPVSVTVTDSGQTYTTPAQWLTVGDGYHAVTPQRIMDTRKGQGANGPIQAMHMVLRRRASCPLMTRETRILQHSYIPGRSPDVVAAGSTQELRDAFERGP